MFHFQKSGLKYWMFCFFFLIPGLSLALGDGKRPLTHDDYDSWKSIRSEGISTDGMWLRYLETPQDGDAFIIVKNLQTGKEYRHLIGYTGKGTTADRSANPQFSYDAKYVVYFISPAQEEVKKAKKKKKTGKKNDKPKKKLAILNLANGEVTVIDSVQSYAMPKEAGTWLAYLKEKPKEKKKDTNKKEEAKEEKEKRETGKSEDKEKKKEKKKKYGSTLILRSLQTGKEKSIPDVLNYRFTKNGKYLLTIISSKKKPETDGIYNLIPGEENAVPLLTGKGNYVKWSFDKEETVLAFLTDRDDYQADEPTFNLYGWKVGDKEARLWVSHKSTKNFPQGMSVSDKSGLTFSVDGKVVLFGIKEIPEPKEDEEDSTKVEEEKAKFDLWHWNDPYPQPQQKKMASRIKNSTWACVYHLKDRKFVRLTDEKLRQAQLHRTGKIAYANDPWPYTKKVAYYGSFNDVYLIDVKTGNRTLVKKELYGRANMSPGGKYVTWFQDKNWYVYNVKSKVTTQITKNLNVRFDREDWDTPSPPRAYGIAGWTDKDRSVLIYDRYDIWEVKPDGSGARMITEGFGRKNDLSFRIRRLNLDKVTFSPDEPLLLTTTNEETMATGFYRDKIKGTVPPEKLMMVNKGIIFYRLKKAKNSDKVIFPRAAFNEYPDYWYSDLEFKNPKKVTDLGKQMAPFLWGHAELVNFCSSDGKPLKGILVKPDNFDPHKKYPLLVYIYETLHQGFYSFRNPSPGTSINPSYYVSNGYVLWMPDIEYDTGYPGKDALKCVLPGIQMLVRNGFIDEKRIGIQGHSWGGYQIAYMVTQTNIFAAAEAGAPVSDMVSSYDGIRWGTGMVRQFQYEHTQSRLGASLWEVPFRYIENSPIFWADNVQTPLLMIHNDKDTAVPWYQGIEYIMALRRLGKEAYMFNYNGEPHGLRKRVNQKDWTRRMQQFFDHYLKGAPEPDWMKNGIKAWEKEDEKK